MLIDTEKTSLDPDSILFKAVLDEVGAYVYVKDSHGRYLYVNEVTRQLFQQPLESIIGHDDSDFFSLQQLSDLRKNDRRVLLYGETIDNEEVNTIKATGQTKIYRSVKKPIFNKQGMIIGLMGISTDITDIHQLKDALQQHQIQLERKNHSLEDEIYSEKTKAENKDKKHAEDMAQKNQELEIANKILINHSNNLQQAIAKKTQELEQSHRARVTLERQHAISQERQRFMRDLHDGMGGYLMTALSYTETTSGKDSTLHKILKLAVSDLRIVINSMEKDDEELMFMLAMFRQRIESMLNIQGIELVWQVEDEPSLASSDPSHSLQILRIVQEAVNNIAKHAQATQARLTLKKNAIVIADNGTGHTQVWTKGHGINNMRQRAQQINAVLDIDTTPSGVSVTLSWPLAMTSSVSVNDYP